MIISQIGRQVLYGFMLFVLLWSCKSQEDVAIIEPGHSITSVNTSPTTDALISGQLIDISGQPLIGAKVAYRVSETSESITFSDEQGKWTVNTEGIDYQGLSISLDGYRMKHMTPPVGSNTVVILREGSEPERDGPMMLEAAHMSASSRGSVSSTAEIRVSSAMDDGASPGLKSRKVGRPESGGKVRPGVDIQAEPGLLTAGEWNDLYNWEDWQELLENQDYRDMQAHWDIYPTSRYSVFVRNQYELPVQDVSVDLVDDSDRVIWTSRTDNAGRAELWGNIETNQKSIGRLHARVSYEGKSQMLKNISSVDAGVNHIDIIKECQTKQLVDVFFAVDATGSMGDEIAYLQEELKDVIERSLMANQSLEVRLGSVFYRDSTDNYLTQSQPLHSDPQKTIDFIATQSASGGGDYPEAVDAALDIALTQDWSEDAVARIIFLMLDAPPHHNPEVRATLASQIKEAAELGIKIIPVTASGINRQTEFLMKFMAMTTNGTYVFITDHSGIGNPHLDPVVQDYEVEKLNDLMVRLLYNYTKSNGCQAAQQVADTFKLYPNPAKDFVTLSTDVPLETVRILSNTGKVVGSQTGLDKGETRLDVSGLIDGMYTIHCVGEKEEYAQPLVVINR